MGIRDSLRRVLGGGGRHDRLTEHDRENRQTRERAVEQLLASRTCDGCGRRCPLSRPHCAHGYEVQSKAIARAGLRR